MHNHQPLLSPRSFSSGLAARTLRNLDFIKNATLTREVHPVTQVVNSLLSVLVFPSERANDHTSQEAKYFTSLEQTSWVGRLDAQKKIAALVPLPSLTINRFTKCNNLRQFYRRLRNAISHRHIDFAGTNPDSSDLALVRVELQDGPAPTGGKPFAPDWHIELTAEDLERLCRYAANEIIKAGC